MRVAPAGHATAEPDVDPPADWPRLKLSIRDSQRHIVGNRLNRAFRKQLPLLQYGTTTVHKAIGLTAEAISIQISAKDKAFQLWETEMLLVIMSRVRRFSDIYIVGYEGQTPEEIKNDFLDGVDYALNKNAPFAAYIKELITKLDYLPAALPVRPPRPLRFLNAQIPADVGYCYLLVSSAFPQYCYVGETQSIANRIQEHNSGRGAISTNVRRLRPWYIALLIVGFPGGSKDACNIHARKLFERAWHDRNSFGPSSAYTPQDAMRNGLDICAEFLQTVDNFGRRVFPNLRPLQNLEFNDDREYLRRLFLSAY